MALLSGVASPGGVDGAGGDGSAMARFSLTTGGGPASIVGTIEARRGQAMMSA